MHPSKLATQLAALLIMIGSSEFASAAASQVGPVLIPIDLEQKPLRLGFVLRSPPNQSERSALKVQERGLCKMPLGHAQSLAICDDRRCSERGGWHAANLDRKLRRDQAVALFDGNKPESLMPRDHGNLNDEVLYSEQDFANFVGRRLEDKMKRCDPDLHSCDGALASLVRPRLSDFMRVHAINAMEWVLLCVTGDANMNQEMEDEIPIICKYYNEFIGKEKWNEEENTFIMVLNKYDEIKSGGYGNFKKTLC